jgi:hypothetical protein
MSDTPEAGVPKALPADPRILLALLSVLAVVSVLMFWPVLTLFYWPAGNGVDVIGYSIGRDFINIWAGPRLAFGGELWALFDLKAYNAGIGAQFGAPLPTHGWAIRSLPAGIPAAGAAPILPRWRSDLRSVRDLRQHDVACRRRLLRPLALLLVLLAPATLIKPSAARTGSSPPPAARRHPSSTEAGAAGVLFGLSPSSRRWSRAAVRAGGRVADDRVTPRRLHSSPFSLAARSTRGARISKRRRVSGLSDRAIPGLRDLMMVSVLAQPGRSGPSQPVAIVIRSRSLFRSWPWPSGQCGAHRMLRDAPSCWLPRRCW